MNEFNIVQNSVIGSLALHSFVEEYVKTKNKVDGVPFPYIFSVLPIIFNNDMAEKISKSQKRTTSFRNILSDNRIFPVGIQERMVDMSEQTLGALNVCFITNLIYLDSGKMELFPKPRPKTPTLSYETNQQILKASKILGYWFASFELEDVCLSLKITF